MRKKIFFVLFIGLFLLTNAGWGEEYKGEYEVIGDLTKLKGLKQVEIEEFFNFSCGHCYGFQKEFEKLKEKYKEKLIYKGKPIFWGNQTPFPAMAYMIAIEKGKGEIAKKEIFDSNFRLGADVFDLRTIGFIIRSLGIADEFEKEKQEGRVKKMVDDVQKLANQYGVKETPTVVINGILKVSPSISKGDVKKMTENLDMIIGDILK
jgi:thiol:disulfide interchange protein DsbA